MWDADSFDDDGGGTVFRANSTDHRHYALLGHGGHGMTGNLLGDITVTEIKTDPPGASPRAFTLSTKEAVKQWRVRPPTIDGEPRGKWLYVDIGFDINGVSTAAEISW